jgi:hypothetical protein
MKHWEQNLVTYLYNRCNKYNISIYFCTSTWNTWNIPWNIWNTWNKRLQHAFFTLLPYDAAQSERWAGRGPAAPSRGEQRGRRGQDVDELCPRCGLPPSLQASEEEDGDRPAMVIGCRQALAWRKGPAAGVGGYRRDLARWGREEGAGGELWPGRRREEGAGGRGAGCWTCHRGWCGMEMPQGVFCLGGSHGMDTRGVSLSLLYS